MDLQRFDYYVNHAPVPLESFVPKMSGECPKARPFIDRQGEKTWFASAEAAREAKRKILSEEGEVVTIEFDYTACRAYNREYEIQSIVQWRILYAKTMIDAVDDYTGSAHASVSRYGRSTYDAHRDLSCGTRHADVPDARHHPRDDGSHGCVEEATGDAEPAAGSGNQYDRDYALPDPHAVRQAKPAYTAGCSFVRQAR
jgi:hypothetical protein